MDALSNFTGSFREWLAKPFDADMSALRWFLFFGLLILISVAWGVIVRKVVD